MVSLHYNNDRYYREMFIYNYLGGNGKIIDCFVVNKGHKNGAELHCVTNHGLIVIYNVNTQKLVTKLVARPQQVIRLYMHTKKIPAKELLELCRKHQEMGFNNL